MEPIKITLEEACKLKDLHTYAASVPVIAMSVRDGVEGNDFSSIAWKSAMKYWEDLGSKYGFDPEKVKGINHVTGEVVFKESTS